MIKKGFRKKVLAGMLAAVTVLGAALEFPVAPQAVYAEDVGLPEETNTSFATARDLVFGTSMAGTWSDNSNKRYYKFSLNEACVINFGMEKSYDTIHRRTDIEIYDTSQTKIYSADSFDHSFSLNPIYLTGGNYYMIVSGQTNGEMTFSFITTMDTTGESFTETQDSNNDMASNASAISLQKKYKGVLAANDDIDYFKFVVSNATAA